MSWREFRKRWSLIWMGERSGRTWVKEADSGDGSSADFDFEV